MNQAMIRFVEIGEKGSLSVTLSIRWLAWAWNASEYHMLQNILGMCL